MPNPLPHPPKSCKTIITSPVSRGSPPFYFSQKKKFPSPNRATQLQFIVLAPTTLIYYQSVILATITTVVGYKFHTVSLSVSFFLLLRFSSPDVFVTVFLTQRLESFEFTHHNPLFLELIHKKIWLFPPFLIFNSLIEFFPNQNSLTSSTFEFSPPRYLSPVVEIFNLTFSINIFLPFLYLLAKLTPPSTSSIILPLVRSLLP